MKLGIIDWGIGGVGLWKKIRESSKVDIIYFSDTGFVPYGKVEKEELRSRLNEVIRFLREKDCDRIAVACNAASTVLPEEKNIFGVIRPAIELVDELKLNSVGVVGGRRTIESEIYKVEFEKRGMRVNQQIAQPLSARIEMGDLNSEELIKDIETIFTPLKNEKYILLACTHYPTISSQINKFLPHTNLIDPISKMCREILSAGRDYGGDNSTAWITTGNEMEMLQSLQRVYSIEVKQIEKSNL